MSKLFETVDNFFDSHFDDKEVFEKCTQCGEYDYMIEGENICPSCKKKMDEADVSIDTDLESTHSDATRIENYLKDVLEGINKDYTLDNIELWITDKGNIWVRTTDGKDIVTLDRSNFTDSDIDELRDKGYFDTYMKETNDDLGESEETDKPYIRNKESGKTMSKEEVEDKWRDQIDTFNTNENDYPFDQYLKDLDETGEWGLITESYDVDQLSSKLMHIQSQIRNLLANVESDEDFEALSGMLMSTIEECGKQRSIDSLGESDTINENEVPASQLDFKHEQLAKVQSDIEVIAELKAEDTSNDLYTDLLDAYDKVVEILTDAIAEDPVGTVIGTDEDDTGLTVDADNSKVNIDIDSSDDVETDSEEPSDEELTRI